MKKQHSITLGAVGTIGAVAALTAALHTGAPEEKDTALTNAPDPLAYADRTCDPFYLETYERQKSCLSLVYAQTDKLSTDFFKSNAPILDKNTRQSMASCLDLEAKSRTMDAVIAREKPLDAIHASLDCINQITAFSYSFKNTGIDAETDFGKTMILSDIGYNLLEFYKDHPVFPGENAPLDLPDEDDIALGQCLPESMVDYETSKACAKETLLAGAEFASQFTIAAKDGPLFHIEGEDYKKIMVYHGDCMKFLSLQAAYIDQTLQSDPESVFKLTQKCAEIALEFSQKYNSMPFRKGLEIDTEMAEAILRHTKGAMALFHERAVETGDPFMYERRGADAPDLRTLHLPSPL